MPGYVTRPTFEDYAARFADYFVMTRRDGIIELRMHTDGGPARFGFEVHNAWGQAWQEIGNDPRNEVLILTGTGDQWLTVDGSPGLPEEEGFEYERLYYDATKLVENFVFGLDIPTIAAINGPSVAHTEFALMCDLTLAAEHATIIDPHFVTGAAPGDGQQLTLQELIGTKRAAHYLYTGDPIDARTALDLGLVNEVLPADRLLPRAWELAERIMSKPKAARRFTHAIVSRPWKQRLVRDLGFGLAHEMFGLKIDRASG